jgi:hypothetical protein
MRLSLLLINAGLVAVTMVLGEQVSANWQYDPVYGGLTQYATPQSQLVNITRNGIGRHPTKLDYNEGAVTYDFQDNLAGQRVMRTRNATGQSVTVSHFVFGGLNPIVEFEGTDKIHYTVGGAYVTVNNSNNNTVQTQYAVRDRLQSTRALLDEAHTVSAQFGYDTLGKPTENDQACTASDCSSAHRYPYRFQGHQYLAWDDSQSGYQPGVTDNKDRLYSHDQGLRFMHTDLASASISPYTAYADDPVNAVDLDGLVVWPWRNLLADLKGEDVVFMADNHLYPEYPQVIFNLLNDFDFGIYAVEAITDIGPLYGEFLRLKQSYQRQKSSPKLSNFIIDMEIEGNKKRYEYKGVFNKSNFSESEIESQVVRLRKPPYISMTEPERMLSQIERMYQTDKILQMVYKKNLRFAAFGGEGFRGYRRDLDKILNWQGGRKLIFTGRAHVFWNENDPRVADAKSVYGVPFTESMNYLEKHGSGIALVVKYARRSGHYEWRRTTNNGPMEWVRVDYPGYYRPGFKPDENRFKLLGTYAPKSGTTQWGLNKNSQAVPNKYSYTIEAWGLKKNNTVNKSQEERL